MVRKSNARFKILLENQIAQLSRKLDRLVVFVVPVGDAVPRLRELVARAGCGGESARYHQTIGVVHGRDRPRHRDDHGPGHQCNFAGIYRRSPLRLNDPELDKRNSELGLFLQKLTWKTVTANPLAGIRD